MMSGSRNSPPISMSSPRETRTSLPRGERGERRAAARRRCCSPRGRPPRPVSARSRSSARAVRRPRAPVTRSTSRSEYPRAAVAGGPHGEPRQRRPPEAGVEDDAGRVDDLAQAGPGTGQRRPAPRARISARSGMSAPRTAAARTSLERRGQRQLDHRPAERRRRALRAGAERRSASREGTDRRRSAPREAVGEAFGSLATDRSDSSRDDHEPVGSGRPRHRGRMPERSSAPARPNRGPLLRFETMDTQERAIQEARERATFSAMSDAWMLRGGGIDILVEGHSAPRR